MAMTWNRSNLTGAQSIEYCISRVKSGQLTSELPKMLNKVFHLVITLLPSIYVGLVVALLNVPRADLLWVHLVVVVGRS